ncbi:MAG: leucyl aminopeptidase [Planctomycetaceae bacterium]
MDVQPISQPLDAVEADWLALGLFEGQVEPPASIEGAPLGDLVGRLLAGKEVPGGLGETTPLLGHAGLPAGSVLLFGLGPRERFDAGAAYAAGAAVARRLAGKPRDSVAVALPESGDPRAIASALTEGVIVGTRGPDLRKSEPGRHPFGTLQVVADPDRVPGRDLREAVRRGEVVGTAINLARDLANLPPAEKPPAHLAQLARRSGSVAGVEVTVWDEDRIRQERFGGVLGVAAGSDAPPAFVVLEYRQGGDGPTLALVGKGVTFDSGGLCLKPSSSMEDMKSDMTGAAVVLATMQAVARLKLPVNLSGYLVLTENMTGGKAMKMGDVLTTRNGKTVEVQNTDAEGRLILADALSYAAEHKPARILDLATLTGSCIVALGTKVAGLFSNDDDFARDVLAACRATGERAWRMPLDEDYQEALKSNVADLKNVGGKWGGAITAAKFLEQFVAAVPWVHLDIAGPSWVDSDGATCDAGGTGCFVRTLVALVEASVRDGPS